MFKSITFSALLNPDGLTTAAKSLLNSDFTFYPHRKSLPCQSSSLRFILKLHLATLFYKFKNYVMRKHSNVIAP